MFGRPVVSASHEMSKLIEPPSFISKTKSFETYKKDLMRWAMLTTLEETKQALLVVHLLDGDPSGIKEKIDEGVSDDDLKSKAGITKLLDFLVVIYKKDSLSDGISHSRGLEEVQAKVSRNLFQNGPQLI